MGHAAIRLGAKPDSHCAGFSETASAQLPEGKIVAIARPYRSPYVWQTESLDGGQTWRQACYAPFSGAGAPVLVAYPQSMDEIRPAYARVQLIRITPDGPTPLA